MLIGIAGREKTFFQKAIPALRREKLRFSECESYSDLGYLWFSVLHFVLHILRSSMETTLTIRLPAKQREALRRRAAAEKRSESALVRDLIEQEIQRGFDFDRVRHLVGSIVSPSKHWEKDPWRKHIRQRNWRG